MRYWVLSRELNLVRNIIHYKLGIFFQIILRYFVLYHLFVVVWPQVIEFSRYCWRFIHNALRKHDVLLCLHSVTRDFDIHIQLSRSHFWHFYLLVRLITTVCNSRSRWIKNYIILQSRNHRHSNTSFHRLGHIDNLSVQLTQISASDCQIWLSIR